MWSLLWWGLSPLWKVISARLGEVLGAKWKVLRSGFKEILSSTIDDLCDVIVESIHEDELWKQWSTDRVLAVSNGEQSELMKVKSFPLDKLSQVPGLARRLEERLKKNVNLDAARNRLNIADAEWDQTISEYAQMVVAYGAAYALERMRKQRRPIWIDEIVLVVVTGEAYRINSHASHFNMVKVYDPPCDEFQKQPSIRKAGRIWDRRLNDGYRYEKGEYQDKNYRAAVPEGR